MTVAVSVAAALLGLGVGFVTGIYAERNKPSRTHCTRCCAKMR